MDLSPAQSKNVCTDTQSFHSLCACGDVADISNGSAFLFWLASIIIVSNWKQIINKAELSYSSHMDCDGRKIQLELFV